MFDGSYRLQRNIYKDGSVPDAVYKKQVREEFLAKKKAIATFMINQFNYGYAITCHKAQGSQWDYVVLIDESNVFGKDATRFLYTAITRAAKKLVIIR
jgi:ATP-dependent exoDNAse (exonuclease V) alpha subunit